MMHAMGKMKTHDVSVRKELRRVAVLCAGTYLRTHSKLGRHHPAIKSISPAGRSDQHHYWIEQAEVPVKPVSRY